ncbi:Uncharacterised protein [Mycobacterium tuberculosis]|nr:Uncharacterised protein [Mycobacterium tuberculosis]
MNHSGSAPEPSMTRSNPCTVSKFSLPRLVLSVNRICP